VTASLRCTIADPADGLKVSGCPTRKPAGRWAVDRSRLARRPLRGWSRKTKNGPANTCRSGGAGRAMTGRALVRVVFVGDVLGGTDSAGEGVFRGAGRQR
jgi:hypothetical protein